MSTNLRRKPKAPVMPQDHRFAQKAGKPATHIGLTLSLLAGLFFSHFVYAEENTGMNIIIRTPQGALNAQLETTPAAKAFFELLPLELTLTDYASTEKVADLPSALTTQGSPEGMTPVVGDITYYAPWGNLAIFYKGFSYSSGLIKLGHINGDLSLLTQEKTVNIRIEQLSINDQ